MNGSQTFTTTTSARENRPNHAGLFSNAKSSPVRPPMFMLQQQQQQQQRQQQTQPQPQAQEGGSRRTNPSSITTTDAALVQSYQDLKLGPSDTMLRRRLFLSLLFLPLLVIVAPPVILVLHSVLLVGLSNQHPYLTLLGTGGITWYVRTSIETHAPNLGKKHEALRWCSWRLPLAACVVTALVCRWVLHPLIWGNRIRTASTSAAYPFWVQVMVLLRNGMEGGLCLGFSAGIVSLACFVRFTPLWIGVVDCPHVPLPKYNPYQTRILNTYHRIKYASSSLHNFLDFLSDMTRREQHHHSRYPPQESNARSSTGGVMDMGHNHENRQGVPFASFTGFSPPPTGQAPLPSPTTTTTITTNTNTTAPMTSGVYDNHPPLTKALLQTLLQTFLGILYGWSLLSSLMVLVQILHTLLMPLSLFPTMVEHEDDNDDEEEEDVGSWRMIRMEDWSPSMDLLQNTVVLAVVLTFFILSLRHNGLLQVFSNILPSADYVQTQTQTLRYKTPHDQNASLPPPTQLNLKTMVQLEHTENASSFAKTMYKTITMELYGSVHDTVVLCLKCYVPLLAWVYSPWLGVGNTNANTWWQLCTTLPLMTLVYVMSCCITAVHVSIADVLVQASVCQHLRLETWVKECRTLIRRQWMVEEQRSVKRNANKMGEAVSLSLPLSGSLMPGRLLLQVLFEAPELREVFTAVSLPSSSSSSSSLLLAANSSTYGGGGVFTSDHLGYRPSSSSSLLQLAGAGHAEDEESKRNEEAIGLVAEYWCQHVMTQPIDPWFHHASTATAFSSSSSSLAFLSHLNQWWKWYPRRRLANDVARALVLESLGGEGVPVFDNQEGGEGLEETVAFFGSPRHMTAVERRVQSQEDSVEVCRALAGYAGGMGEVLERVFGQSSRSSSSSSSSRNKHYIWKEEGMQREGEDGVWIVPPSALAMAEWAIRAASRMVVGGMNVRGRHGALALLGPAVIHSAFRLRDGCVAHAASHASKTNLSSVVQTVQHEQLLRQRSMQRMGYLTRQLTGQNHTELRARLIKKAMQTLGPELLLTISSDSLATIVACDEVAIMTQGAMTRLDGGGGGGLRLARLHPQACVEWVRNLVSIASE